LINPVFFFEGEGRELESIKKYNQIREQKLSKLRSYYLNIGPPLSHLKFRKVELTLLFQERQILTLN